MDPLADVLDLSRVRGALLANVCARAPWGLDIPQSAGASFHALISGTAWLRFPESDPIQLMPGDVLLLPTGAAHCLSSEPDGACEPFDRIVKEQLIGPDGKLELGASGAATTFVCAGYDYDHDVAGRLLGVLPAVLHVPADPVGERDIAAIVTLLASEVGGAGAGSRAAIARLIDLLLIAAVRSWSRRQQPNGRPSWLVALHDPTIARVLALLHERPAEPWTLERLAREVHVSRATLARRFADAVGESPLAYLARWRMDLAARRLKTSTDSVETIANEVGYQSAYAFNRAFARYRGQPPGRYRRAELTAAG
ncbi:MAG TPA: AraC family transcriptional regulator [Solirubrobacter sp.]|nr:AraC family transcriptional regulator [Solirubrobacter sp.]